MTRTRILAALATLAVGFTLAGAGTATAFAAAAARPAPAPVTVAARTTGSASATTAAPPSGTGGTTGDEAGRIAVRHLGDGSVTRVEREFEHGRQVWDVDVRRGDGTVEVHVDALTGAVSRVESRDDRRGGDDRGTNDRDDRGRGDR